MGDTNTGDGKVVVNRAMSLDGFIAAPGDVVEWGAGRKRADFVAADDFLEIAAATGAMLAQGHLRTRRGASLTSASLRLADSRLPRLGEDH
jgi:hypothetical protein